MLRPTNAYAQTIYIEKAYRWNSVAKSLDRNSITRTELRCKCYDTNEGEETWKEEGEQKNDIQGESEKLAVGTRPNHEDIVRVYE